MVRSGSRRLGISTSCSGSSRFPEPRCPRFRRGLQKRELWMASSIARRAVYYPIHGSFWKQFIMEAPAPTDIAVAKRTHIDRHQMLLVAQNNAAVDHLAQSFHIFIEKHSTELVNEAPGPNESPVAKCTHLDRHRIWLNITPLPTILPTHTTSHREALKRIQCVVPGWRRCDFCFDKLISIG